MKILIVDDHALFREGLASVLQADPGFEVCGQAGTLAEAVALARAIQPEMILMDYGLPDGTGAEAARAILAEVPACRVVFVTVHMDDDELFDAVRSGAKGYLLKNVPIDTLLGHLRTIQAGGAVLSPQMIDRVLEEFGRLGGEQRRQNQPLTPRETEVLQLVAGGLTNKEIADTLFIAENTVKRHVHNILKKLDVSNRRAAAKWAREQ
jgi:two-component system NarL family response regulator